MTTTKELSADMVVFHAKGMLKAYGRHLERLIGEEWLSDLQKWIDRYEGKEKARLAG